jgi:hypothetical protein
MVALMATNVSLVVLTNTPSRLVLATVPETHGWLRAWRKPQVDAPLETWDFDRETGTLVVTSVTHHGAESLEVPLAAVIRLRLAGVEATASDSYCDYELQLSYEDGSPLGRMVTLPSCTRFRAKRQNGVRSAQSRLRAFLRPACPKLEGTLLEELCRWFTMGHQQRLQRMGEWLGKLQAGLEAISQHPHTPGMDVLGWKEKLQGYQEKLKQAQSGEKPAWHSGWLVPAIGAFLWGFILFRWLSR